MLVILFGNLLWVFSVADLEGLGLEHLDWLTGLTDTIYFTLYSPNIYPDVVNIPRLVSGWA